MTEFITRDYGQKEFEVIIKTDNKDHYKATEDFARKLIDHAKPQTHADAIQAMSDEELAEFLYAEEWSCDTYYSCSVCPLRGEKECMSVLEWLKQPVEE